MSDDRETASYESLDETIDHIPPTILQPESSSAAATGDVFPPGYRFGDFEIIEEIDRGGMGIVLKAKQLSLDRIVALKLIHKARLSDPETVARFRAEAEAAAQLAHVGIVPIYEVGAIGGQHFFSMGYIEGTSLQGLITDGPLSPRKAVEIVHSICEAIAYAHEIGVIHRDLKPGNVLIDQSGQPKVTDFGLAKRTQRESDMTMAGQIMGTPSYMSPEQAYGSIAAVGERSDVYSLGAILYCLLTGRAPFAAGDVIETLRQVREDEPVSPSRLNSAIDKDLETISLKCLEKSPDRRYATAAELSSDLKRYLEGKPILARPVNRIERLWRWCRRNQRVAVLSGVAVLLLVAFVIAVAVGYVRTTNALGAKSVALGQKNQALTAATKARQEAERRSRQVLAQRLADVAISLLDSDLDLALLLSAEAVDSSIKHQDPIEPQAHRAALQALFRKMQRDFPVPCYDPEFTGDARWLVTQIDYRPRKYRLYPLRNDAPRTAVDIDDSLGTVSATAVSADSKWLAVGYLGGTIRVTRLDQPRAVEIRLTGHTKAINDLEFHPGSGMLGSGSDDGDARIWIVDAKSSDWKAFRIPGRSPVRPGVPDLPGISSDKLVRDIAFSPNGRWFAAATGRTICAVEVVADKLGRRQYLEAAPRTLRFRNSPLVSWVTFSLDSQWVLGRGSNRDFGAKLWRIGSKEIDFKGTSIGAVLKPTFSPDGKWLAARSSDRVVKLWNLTAANPANSAIELPRHSNWIDGITFATDGRLLTSDRNGDVLEWNPGDAVPKLHSKRFGRGSGYGNVAVDATGKWFAACDDNPPRVRVGKSSINGIEVQSKLLFPRIKNSLPSLIGVRSINFNSAGTILVCVADLRIAGNPGRFVMVWKKTHGKFAGPPVLLREEGFPTEAKLTVTSSHDSEWLFVSGQTAVGAWRLAAMGQSAQFVQHSNEPTCRVTDATGRWLAIGRSDETVHLFDLTSENPISDRVNIPTNNGPPRDLAFTADGKLLFVLGSDPTIAIWEIKDNAKPEMKTVHQVDPAAARIRLFGNGERAILLKRVGSASTTRWVPMTACDFSGTRRSFLSLAEETRFAAFSPAGNMLLTGTARAVRVQELSSEARRRSFDAKQAIVSAEFSPNGKWLLICSDKGKCMLWQTPDFLANKPPVELDLQMTGSFRVAFTPHSDKLVAAANDQPQLFVCDLTENPLTSLKKLEGHGKGVRGFAISPDGTLLASVGNDKIARLWRLNDELSSLILHRNAYGGSLAFRQRSLPRNNVFFDPRGRWLLTWRDGVQRAPTLTPIEVLTKSPADVVSLARRLADRELTIAERSRFLIEDQRAPK